MRDGESGPAIGWRALFAAALAATALAGCTRAQWRHTLDPAPAATSAQRNATRSAYCQLLLTRANELAAVPGDSLMGQAAVRTSIAFTLAMSDYSTCMALAAMP